MQKQLCHRIAIITNGTLRVIRTMEELRKTAGKEQQDIDLEDIFLELTGVWEVQQVILRLRRSEMEFVSPRYIIDGYIEEHLRR